MQGLTPEQKIELFIKLFSSLLFEAMPFIVLGAVIAGLLEELVPQRFVARIIPRSRTLAIAIGGFLGIMFPMCECGIIPVMRRLLRKGVPLSSCVCYMLAGPIINVVVMFSTYVAFSGADRSSGANSPAGFQLGGWQMMTLRMVLGYLVAFGTSLIVEWQYRKHGNKLLAPLAVPKIESPEPNDETNGEESVRRKSWLQRLASISETTLHDFVDVTVFLIIGALLAISSRFLFSREDVDALAGNYVLVIGIMMGLAILLCICSEADAFVAASFSNLPPASKLAFLVLGPMLDLKLYMMYTRVFRPRLIWTIICSVVAQVFIYAIIVHLLLEHLWIPYMVKSPGS